VYNHLSAFVRCVHREKHVTRIKALDSLDISSQAFDFDGNGCIDNEEFRSFSLALEARPAVKAIFSQFAKGPRMTVAELESFLQNVQKVRFRFTSAIHIKKS